jgi:hypothetical protein
MAAGSTYTPIATQTLSSSATSVTFSSIPQTYTDLVLICDMAYTSTSTTYQGFRVGNGSADSGANYSGTWLRGSGSAVTSGNQTGLTYYNLLSNATGTTRVQTITNIFNYSNTTTYKSEITRTVDQANGPFASVYLWRNTAAINTVQVLDLFGLNFAAGSTFTLYGIAAA